MHIPNNIPQKDRAALERIETKKTEARDKRNRATRVAAGYYAFYDGECTFEITRISEGTYKGWWAILNLTRNTQYDPVPRLKDAERQLSN